MKYNTKIDAVRAMVNNFDAIPQYLIAKAYGEEPETFLELTAESEDDTEEDIYREWLPMWGWMWIPDSSTSEFIRENLEAVLNLGFRIYEDQDEGDVYIGIDGAGFDFYEAYWEPLYDLQGLRWYKEE